MVSFEQLNIFNFAGYKCSMFKDSNNYITVASNKNFLEISVVVTDIVATMGKYTINLNIVTSNQLYWHGTYDGAKKILLSNGKNTFTIDIVDKQKSFAIGIFSDILPIGHSFILQNISVNKSSLAIENLYHKIDNTPLKAMQTTIRTHLGQKSRRKQQIYNKSSFINTMYKTNNDLPTYPTTKMSQPNNKLIELLNLTNNPSPKSINDSISSSVDKISNVDNKVNKINGMNNKKNILLVIDVKKWCFDNIANEIKKYYDQHYNIYVECCMYNPNYQNYSEIKFDLIIKFWYGYEKIDPYIIYPDAIKVVCVYDYIHWNKYLTNFNNTQIYKNFIKNVAAADYVLYSCPTIKNLLLEQHSNIINSEKLYPAFDGVDTNAFYPKEYVGPNDKLVVGWVGNTKNINKKFSIINNILGNVKWIDFMVQDNINFISHSEMVNFYQKIDVLVCLSSAEGTPNPILEASACGKTWISTNVGIVELLYNVNNDNIKPGFIISGHNDLLPKLDFLHKNRSMMKEMGTIARKNVEKDFSWEQRIKVFGNIFEKILENGQDYNKIEFVDRSDITNESIISDESIITDENIIISAQDRIEIKCPNQADIPNKIIITSTQYPRYGGAATSAYEMHKYLLSNNISSICIFFDNSVKNNIELLNPDNLVNVYNEVMPRGHQNLYKYKYDNIQKIINNVYGEEPYTIYSFNYFAPIISKYIFKKSKIHYMITGCNYINNDNLIDSLTLLNHPIDIHTKNSMEKITVNIADVIVPNSDLTKNIFEHCYKTHINDFIDLHEIFKINDTISQNKNRTYDISFICSDFNRKVKNINFIKNIFYDNSLKKYNKICIGKNSENIINSDLNYNVVCKDFMTQNEIIAILNNSKIVLVASLIETYSITAVEATQCGCIVLSNKNSACSSTFNKFFVLDSYDLNEWTNKISTILNNYVYFKNIFINDYCQTRPIENLWSKPLSNNKKINIVCCSIDIPYIGGCATNTYRIIKYLQTDANLNVYGIFISNNENDHNPEKLNNIYKITFDENTEKNLLDVKNEIITQISFINFIFFKNYKIFPFIKKVFNNTKLIFSPSGLRNISGNTAKEYVIDMDMGHISTKPLMNFSNVDNIYRFIQDNDIHLDIFALKQSDIVIPNSLLSYNIIHNFYPGLPNLSYPVYITNIIYENVHENNFNDRTYDIMFCSYDWKRECKNYQMVLNILKNNQIRNLKVIVVGKSQIKNYDNSNVLRYDYLNNEKVIDILKSVKVVVIPSKFDSNPNVLVEAISSGCNVVTSRNVGNSENLDNTCIVDDYQNVDGWVKTIIQCTNCRYEYKGPKQCKVLSTIKDFFLDDKKSKKSVCVYKIPPEFNSTINNETLTRFTYVNYINATDDAFAYDIINYDIYFNMFVKISMKEKCSSINYIIYDGSIEENIYVNVNLLYPTYPKGIVIWKIKDIESFSYFTNADFYFIRGTYYNFFKQLVPKTAKTVFYPATSMKQSLNGNNNYGAFLLTQQKFDVVLCHEDFMYNKIYNSEKFVVFDKFATDKFVCFGNTREYDICYVATEKQPTKNHDLFFNFILYLEAIKRECNIIYVGNLEKIIFDTGMKDIREKLSYVNLHNVHHCNHYELINIYNKSKINILFSGRDALPRVVSESSACGCFNIALDTLSDGKSFYDGILGVLLGDPSVKKVLKPSSSLSYVHDFKLWNVFIPYLDASYNHSEISLIFKQKYNIDNIVNEICS
jgi:glycosyltransferase involved in cell wall biosynthesis